MAFFSPSFSPIERITLATWARFALRRIIPPDCPPNPVQDPEPSPSELQLWYNASTSPFVQGRHGGPFISLRFSYDPNSTNLPVTMSMMPPWNASTNRDTIDAFVFESIIATDQIHMSAVDPASSGLAFRQHGFIIYIMSFGPPRDRILQATDTKLSSEIADQVNAYQQSNLIRYVRDRIAEGEPGIGTEPASLLSLCPACSFLQHFLRALGVL